MKRIGFLSFGHWRAAPGSQTRTASDALLQTIELAQAAEDLGVDGAFVRVHHFERQLASPFPLLAAIGARTSRIEIGTAVIDMRYENPLYLAEEAAAADLISGGRLQLGVSRGSPETVLRGAESFGYRPADGETDADAARRKTEIFLAAIGGAAVARTDPARTGVSGGLAIQPQSPGLADRIWWGSGTRATAQWAAQAGDEPAEFHAAVRRHRRPVRPAPGGADPAVPRGVGGARLAAGAAGLGLPQRAADHRGHRPDVLR